jgi:hypothetical protein
MDKLVRINKYRWWEEIIEVKTAVSQLFEMGH